MKHFALIGHPVANSRSPQLFAAAYGGKYSYVLLDGEDFAPLWEKFLTELDGINITAPYKLALRRGESRGQDSGGNQGL